MEEKNKQVNIRMPEKVFKELKLSLIADDKTFVDFFNDSAKAYLSDKDRYESLVSEIIGGK